MHIKDPDTDHPINEMFLRRWSPCAFSERPVPEDDLRSIFEAARWAESSYNEQPWRYIVARKSAAGEFEKLLSCLVPGNQIWARTAPVLAIGCASLKFARNDKPNAAALHDLGIASAHLTIEATSRGLYVHQMAGILPDKVREVYGVPEGVQPLTGLAIGYLADPEILPEPVRERDRTKRVRKKLGEFVFEGSWGTSASLVK